ncbi:uncharacterized protein OCT59_019512 [Rhizophagus irregularis]|uniref:Uncharacterized protein n=1 Tax=Rhizophagus irregularis (strain DAOM 197198w) TaxID=1432141 RepID=A0A015IZP0_RHIIW|nr:hypothetical protein RirG_159090 [Rhizophagus irregularis DAOM 197198w]UZO27311.1 hypothetical protein OCT59_019512 [Rhizophagus irregularis]GBC51520.2 hypothetical protein GLOIN_2v1790331 [Rhizophagus irregularis DAOM 181602=DAOM 197198]CAG8636754.1 22639_t:CDS:1 [Rhizophagus irregularis]
MNNNSSRKDMIEGLAKAFTADIINEITKFQTENDSLIQNNILLKSENLNIDSVNQMLKSDLLLEKRNCISQVNELKELKAENKSLETETISLHSEVCKLQSEIDEIKSKCSNEVKLLSQNRILTNEKKNLTEEIKKLNEQLKQYKVCKKQPKRKAFNSKEKELFKLELATKNRCIKDLTEQNNFLFFANSALTDEKIKFQSENNKFKQDINEKDNENKILISKNRELEQIIISEKNKFEELENWFVSYQNHVIKNHMTTTIQEYSNYF